MAIPIVGMLGMGAIAGFISQLSSLFDSPAAKIFTRTLADINAVIGQMLTPVFRVANTVMRMVGDTLASITPAMQTMFMGLEDAFVTLRPVMNIVQRGIIAAVTTFGELAKSVFELISATAAALGFGDAVTTVGDTVTSVAQVIIASMKVVQQIVMSTRDLVTKGRMPSFNFSAMWAAAMQQAEEAIKKVQIRSSFGASQRSAQYMGFEDFAKQARVSAFQTGLGTVTDKPELAEAKKQTTQLTALNAQIGQLVKLNGQIYTMLDKDAAGGYFLVTPNFSSIDPL